MAMVAALNLEIYEQLQPILSDLLNLDEEVATALARIRTDRTAAIEAIGNYLEPAYKLEKQLPPELARILKAANIGWPG